jgi:hypothetical protein
MQLFAKYLWRHVAGRSAGIKGLFAVLSSSYSEIGQSQVALFIKN